MRTFNIVFKLPANEEFVVAAWAAICSYEKKLREMRVPFQTFLLSEETWLTNLIIPPMTFMTNSIEELSEIHFDLVMDMSEDKAIDLGKTGRTAAQAYGVLIGIEEKVNELVVIPHTEKLQHDICIIYWNEESRSLSNKVCQRFQVNVLELHEEESKIDPLLFAKLILSSKILFGRRSIYTYLAACTNRAVIEGYSLDEYPKELFSKWGNARYNMLCVEKKEDLDKNYSIIWRALERAINSLPKKVEMQNV